MFVALVASIKPVAGLPLFPSVGATLALLVALCVQRNSYAFVAAS